MELAMYGICMWVFGLFSLPVIVMPFYGFVAAIEAYKELIKINKEIEQLEREKAALLNEGGKMYDNSGN